MNNCLKCRRHTEQKLSATGNWETYDVAIGKLHYLYCHPDTPTFKVYDEIIMFWPKSVKIYVIEMVNKGTLSYWLTERLTTEHKVVTFNKVEQNAKLMDPIYELLYL